MGNGKWHSTALPFIHNIHSTRSQSGLYRITLALDLNTTRVSSTPPIKFTFMEQKGVPSPKLAPKQMFGINGYVLQINIDLPSPTDLQYYSCSANVQKTVQNIGRILRPSFVYQSNFLVLQFNIYIGIRELCFPDISKTLTSGLNCHLLPSIIISPTVANTLKGDKSRMGRFSHLFTWISLYTKCKQLIFLVERLLL